MYRSLSTRTNGVTSRWRFEIDVVGRGKAVRMLHRTRVRATEVTNGGRADGRTVPKNGRGHGRTDAQSLADWGVTCRTPDPAPLLGISRVACVFSDTLSLDPHFQWTTFRHILSKLWQRYNWVGPWSNGQWRESPDPQLYILKWFRHSAEEQRKRWRVSTQDLTAMKTARVVVHTILLFSTSIEALSVREAEVDAVNLKVAHYLGLEEVPDWENVSLPISVSRVKTLESFGTPLQEICSCSCLIVLPGPTWVLNKIYIFFRAPVLH